MERTEPTDGRNGQLDRELNAYSAAARTALSVAVEQERRSTPDHRLAVYSGVAGAALAGAFTAEAAVVYKTVNITMDGGGTGGTGVHSTFVTFSGTSNARFFFRHNDAVGGDAGFFGAVKSAAVVQTGGNNSVINSSDDQTIQTRAGNKWSTSGIDRRLFLATPAKTGTPTSGNFWDTNTGYIGVRYANASGTHYGWIHVDSVDNGLESYHISGYAYNDTADATTKAGEMPVPEPSTVALALLASGAAGLMSARRKKLLREKREG